MAKKHKKHEDEEERDEHEDEHDEPVEPAKPEPPPVKMLRLTEGQEQVLIEDQTPDPHSVASHTHNFGNPFRNLVINRLERRFPGTKKVLDDAAAQDGFDWSTLISIALSALEMFVPGAGSFLEILKKLLESFKANPMQDVNRIKI